MRLQLTDYLDGELSPETSRLVGEHALRCPVCHETLLGSEEAVLKPAVRSVPVPSRELEARILQKTIPETVMTCENFEDYLTDYLDGFLPANFIIAGNDTPRFVIAPIAGCIVAQLAHATRTWPKSRPVPEAERKNSSGDARNSCSA